MAGPPLSITRVAAAAAGHAIALAERRRPPSRSASSANLVSAAVRLGVVGQTEAQKIVAALMPKLAAMAAQALHADPETAGACAFRSDIAAMKHESQYSRLFRS